MLVHRDYFIRCLRKAKPFIILIGVLTIISSMTPSTSQAQPIQKKDATKATIKELTLWAQQGGGDFINWVTSWNDNELPVSLKFRWKHNLDKAGFVGWEVYALGNRIEGPVSVGTVPQKLTNAFFSIPFRNVVENLDLSTFEVRILAYTAKPPVPGASGIQIKSKLLARSEPVMVTRQGPGDDTQFNVPKLKVTFKEIVVIDDSDDLSAGEIGFAFWAEYSNTKTEYLYHEIPGEDNVDSGESVYPNATLTIENPPNLVRIYVYGVDDDSDIFTTCGNLPGPNQCPDGMRSADPATGYFDINTGITSGDLLDVQHAWKYFSIHANGAEDLEFKVFGYYEITPN